MKKLLWTILYVVTGIWLQRFFPEWCVDVFLPLIVVFLELKEHYLLLFLIPLWILVQEGTGFITFGSSILILSCVMVSFSFYKTFFSFTNFLFVFAFSFTNIIFQTLIVILISYIQGIELNLYMFLEKQLKYFFIFIVMLYINFFVYKYLFKSTDNV